MISICIWSQASRFSVIFCSIIPASPKKPVVPEAVAELHRVHESAESFEYHPVDAFRVDYGQAHALVLRVFGRLGQEVDAHLYSARCRLRVPEEDAHLGAARGRYALPVAVLVLQVPLQLGLVPPLHYVERPEHRSDDRKGE